MIRAKSIGLSTGLLMAGLSGMLGGCGGTTATTDAGTDTGGGSDTPVAGGRTYDFAITTLAIDGNTSATMPHTGFNVDGRYSPATMQQPADCDHRDYFSAIDPDQNEMGCTGGTATCKGGVDNQLPELAGAAMMLIDIRAALTTAVSSGSVALLVRVENVNDLQNDSAVNVTIYQGHPMFASCSNIGMPNQPYAIDGMSSFMPGTTTPRYSFPGSIVNGRLRLSPASAGGTGNVFQLPLPSIMGVSLTLNLYNTSIRVGVTETGGTNGNLGGYVLRSDLLTALGNIPQAAMYRTIIEGLINGLVDVQTMSSCDAPNGGIGMGLGFTLTNATIQAAPVTGGQPGMCGGM